MRQRHEPACFLYSTSFGVWLGKEKPLFFLKQTPGQNGYFEIVKG